MKKKLRLKESVKNIIAVSSFYLIIVIGVIAINFRLGNLEQTKSADESVVQTAQNLNR